MSDQKQKKPIHKRWWFWPVVVVFGLGAIGSLVPETEEQKAERAKQEADRQAETAKREADRQAEQVEKERKKVADREAGFHCLSSWDGSSRNLVLAVKQNLRNPDSFEHIETRITKKDAENRHRILMQYRAENGFGGMNVEMVRATIDHESCELVGPFSQVN